MIRLLALLLLTFSFAAAQEPAPPVLKLEVKADYVALRVTGATNMTAHTWQWRVLPRTAEDQVAWSPFDGPSAEGAFKLATPMPVGGWYRVEVRALDGDKLLKTAGVTRPEPHPFQMVTAERIAALPEEQRAAWTAWLAKSQELAQNGWRNSRVNAAALGPQCRNRRPWATQNSNCPAKWTRLRLEVPSQRSSRMW
jgi:hypothetical protein